MKAIAIIAIALSLIACTTAPPEPPEFKTPELDALNAAMFGAEAKEPWLQRYESEPRVPFGVTGSTLFVREGGELYEFCFHSPPNFYICHEIDPVKFHTCQPAAENTARCIDGGFTRIEREVPGVEL